MCHNSYSNIYLAHYGVKGMKWGVRRYRNEDGSLTALGQKKYEYQQAKKAPGRKDSVEIAFRKREFKDQKIREKIANQKSKSKRQTELENKYLKEGFTKDEASIQAYKRIRAERALVAVGGMTLAGLGAYAAYKHYDNTTDRLLKSGTSLGRISSNDDKSVKDAFYAFANKHDEKRYTGMYGHQTMMMNDGRAFKKTMSVGKSGIKVASRDSAKKVLSDLYKNDSEYRDTVNSMVKEFNKSNMGIGKTGRLFRNAWEDLQKGKITDKSYDAINALLTVHDDRANKASSKLYSALKDAGYSAIRDINDVKYSGYRARNPLIIFDNSKVNVEAVTELGARLVSDLNVTEQNKVASRAIGESLTPYLIAGLAGRSALSVASSASDNRFVQNYRKEHPESQLSRNEILRLKDAK